MMFTSAAPPKAGPSVPSGPSAAGRARESSRSSRRRMGSTAPVQLGGGVGVLGAAKAMEETKVQASFQPSRPYPTLPPPSYTHTITTGVDRVHPHPHPHPHPSSSSSSTSTNTPTPTPTAHLPAASNMYPSPPPSLGERAYSAPTVPLSDSSRLAGSTTSFASTASSTSSRTLKTPHSKLDHPGPIVVTSSGSLDSQAVDSPPHAQHQHRHHGHSHHQAMAAANAMGSKGRAAGMSMGLVDDDEPEWSPTPTHRLNTRRSIDKLKNSPPVGRLPAMAQGPLPPTPSSSDGRSTPTTDATRSVRGATKPLHFKRSKKPLDPNDGVTDHRLSQGWMQVDEFGDVHTSTPPRAHAHAHAHASSTGQPTRPPGGPTMVPMKSASDDTDEGDDSPSPYRPRYERAHTEPPLSPTEARSYRLGLKSGGDHMRSTSPTPLGGVGNSRPRQASLSSPPEAVMATDMGPGGKYNMFRTAPTSTRSQQQQQQQPPLLTRRSEDLIRRPSNDALRSGEYHHQPQQAREGPVFVPLSQEEKKPSNLMLKKSSGALKALFRGKGKEKDSSALGGAGPNEGKHRSSESKNRPSIDDLRLRSSSSHSRTSPGSSPAISTPPTDYGRRTPDSFRGSTNSVASGPSAGTGRSSFALERSLYPTPPQMQRAASAGAAPTLQVHVPTRSAAPGASRDLPPLPPPSPVPSTSTAPSPSSVLTPIDKPTSRDRLSPAPSPAGSDTTTQSVRSGSTVSSTSTTRPSISPLPYDDDSTANAGANKNWSPIKPSKSLQLLSLPELDLDFNVAFDSFGSSTPSTPRRSPKHQGHGANGSPSRSHSISFSPSHPRSPASLSPSSSPSLGQQRSPTRSRSINSSSLLNRTVSERRRSRSFDAGDDEWRPLGIDVPPSSVAKLFASTSSSSAPVLAPPKELPISSTAATEASHSHSLSDASQKSGPSSSDHTSTPSDAASTHQTSTPSPPHTPEDRTTPQLPSLGFEGVPLPSALKPGVANITAQPVSYTSTSPDLATSTLTPVAHPAEIAITISLSHSSGSLAPAALIEDVEANRIEVDASKVVRKPEARKAQRVLQSRSMVVVPNPKITINVLAREMEVLLYSYRYPATAITSGDRSTLIRDELIPCLLEVEKRSCGWARDDLSAWHTLREASFEWADMLLYELSAEQPAHERGACLEGLGAILESSCMSARMLEDPRAAAHAEAFKGLLMRVMNQVMEKLGAKGVFHNTLLFSGRFLAFAFFRIPHIAEQLVTVLHPPRGALARFTASSLMSTVVPPEAAPSYPSHLLPLCFDNARAYNDRLGSLTAEFSTEEERDAYLFTPGNWLRRWQSDDSELFPAFYRAYHRQLAAYLAPAIEYYEARNQPLPASVLLRAPGYAHLATIFAKKCHSYILGSVNAVTTSSAAQNFEATETAGFKGSQKPAVLDTANRRLVETLATFANMRVMVPTNGRVMECDGTQMWTSMLDLWTRSLINKTNLYAPKGVFCLFDLLDGIVDPPTEVVTELTLTTSGAESLLDVPYLIHMVRLILTEGEHALTLVKAIAFVFTHWEVLTARPEDRRELCLDVLLDKTLFERLLLFWSQSVRSYVLRLVVFRLGHLHTRQEDGANYEVEIESVKLLQTRLDRIKKRHDELEPRPPSDDEHEIEQVSAELAGQSPVTPTDDRFSINSGPPGSGSGMTRSRSTIHMVADSPRSGSANKAERLLGLGFVGDSASAASGLNRGSDIELGSGANGDPARKVGKAANWFKRSFGGGGKQKGKKGSMGPGSEHGGGSSPNGTASPNPSPILGSSPSLYPATQSPSLNDVSPLLPASGSPNLGVSPKHSVLGLPASAGSDKSRLEPAQLTLQVPHRLASPIPSLRSPSPEVSPIEPSEAATSPTQMRRPRPPQIQTDVANANAKATTAGSASTQGTQPTQAGQGQARLSNDRRRSMSPAPGGSTNGNGALSPNTIAFEFELPTASPRSDTFDPTPTPTPGSPSARRSSQPPSPRQPQSPHMSRSFSKRSSLLPPSTASALDSIMAAGGVGSEKEKEREKEGLDEEKKVKKAEEEKGYEKKLHAYAIRMLAELEDAQKEYDEWWADGGIGKMDGAPPRLVVAWPFHDEE